MKNFKLIHENPVFCVLLRTLGLDFAWLLLAAAFDVACVLQPALCSPVPAALYSACFARPHWLLEFGTTVLNSLFFLTTPLFCRCSSSPPRVFSLIFLPLQSVTWTLLIILPEQVTGLPLWDQTRPNCLTGGLKDRSTNSDVRRCDI